MGDENRKRGGTTALPRRLRWGIAPLVLAMMVLVMSMGWLGWSQAKDLDTKLAAVSETVGANLRVPSQTQREVLRLLVELERRDPDPVALELARSFVGQRLFELTRESQQPALARPDLVDDANALQRRWEQSLGPQVAASVRTGGVPAALPAEVAEFERAINRLVADVELARRGEAAEVRDDAVGLIERTQLLLIGLGTLLLMLLVLLVVGGVIWRRVDQDRADDARQLAELNAELIQLSEVAARTDNPVVITDGAGVTEWVNDAFTKVTGYPFDQAVGVTPGALLQGPDTDPAAVTMMREAVAAGRGFESEVLNYTADGEPHWIQMAVTPVHDRVTGELVNFIAVQRDVTERHEFEAELLRAKQAAEETAQGKTTFLASMSHEIRTPLNAVVGATQLLSAGGLEPGQQRYADIIQDSSRLLLSLIDDILSFSALGDGPVELDPAPTEVVALVTSIVGMFGSAAEARNLELHTVIDPALPISLHADETRLRQVLNNLLANAVKFTTRGHVRIAVHLERMIDPALPGHPAAAAPPLGSCVVRFDVSDTGCGIDPERTERIFEPFTQEDASVHRRYGGTGLGLAISKRIVDAMGGAIEVASVQGEGSIFSVRVELPIASFGPATSGPAPRRRTRSDAPLAGIRVLVVEDDPINELIVLALLGGAGCQPEVARTGEEALIAATGGTFDVVLTDIELPGLDGEELMVRMRSHPWEGLRPRVVALTANALPGDRERLLAAGFDGYLSKPVDEAALIEALMLVGGSPGTSGAR